MPVTPRFRWSLATPLLVLVGLFGMHGLAEHGEAGSHAEMAMAAPTSTWVTVPASTALTIESSRPTAVLSTPMETAMSLCLAVLLGGFVAWLLLARGSRRTPWLLPRQAATAVPVPRGRAPDPPSLHALSVHRC